MVVIIAGSRGMNEMAELEYAVKDSLFSISQIISGGAGGVDTLAIQFAEKYKIPYLVMEAEWQRYGTIAGKLRNSQMAKQAEACIVIKLPQSGGSEHMIEQAKIHNLKLFIRTVNPDIFIDRPKPIQRRGL